MADQSLGVRYHGFPNGWLQGLQVALESFCCPGRPCCRLSRQPEAPCKCQSSVSVWPPSDEWKLSAAVFALAYTLPGSCLDSHLISHVYRELPAGPAATRKSSYVTGFLAGGQSSDYRLYQRPLGFGCCHYKKGSRSRFCRSPGQEICYCEIMRPAVCALALAG